MVINKPPDYSLSSRVQSTVSSYRKRTGREWLKALASYAPITDWLPKYKLKSWAHHDLMAGITVGVVNVPQGMAYGLLAGVTPVIGLYTSMIFPFIYTFFGTSRHAAIGTFAVTSIMTAEVLATYASPDQNYVDQPAWKNWWCGYKVNTTGEGAAFQEHEKLDRENVAITLCFLIAVIHIDIIFGVDQVINTFKPPMQEVLTLPRFYVCLVSEIPGFNWQPFVISLVCVGILIVVKLYIDPKTKPKIKFPIPIELILVTATTILQWQVQINPNEMSVVGNVVKGFPKVKLPVPSLMLELIPSAISISIMLYSIEVSIAKLFAERNNYKIDPNQEWLGIGMAHLVGSFFQCTPGGASMSRSMIQGSQGCKSPLVGMINAIIIFLVLLLLVGVFQYLPECTLSSIIVVSLKGLFLQFNDLPDIYKKSKTDFTVWMVTFFATVLFTTKIGLFVGVGFSLAVVIYRSIWPNVYMQRMESLGAGGGGGVGEGKLIDVDARESGLDVYHPAVLPIRFSAPISYLNVENIRHKIFEITEINPLWIKRKINKRKSRPDFDEEEFTIEHRRGVRYIVCDCSTFSFLDIMSGQLLKQLYHDYASIGIDVVYANLTDESLRYLERADLLGEKKIEVDAILPANKSIQQFIHDFAVRERLRSQSLAYTPALFPGATNWRAAPQPGAASALLTRGDGRQVPIQMLSAINNPNNNNNNHFINLPPQHHRFSNGHLVMNSFRNPIIAPPSPAAHLNFPEEKEEHANNQVEINTDSSTGGGSTSSTNSGSRSNPREDSTSASTNSHSSASETSFPSPDSRSSSNNDDKETSPDNQGDFVVRSRRFLPDSQVEPMREPLANTGGERGVAESHSYENEAYSNADTESVVDLKF